MALRASKRDPAALLPLSPIAAQILLALADGTVKDLSMKWFKVDVSPAE